MAADIRYWEMPTPGGNEYERTGVDLAQVDHLEEGEREVMKRIRLLILLGMVAIALPLGILQGVAKATGSPRTSVSISPTADFNTFGAQLDVQLFVRCTGGSGTAMVTVTQTNPETGDPAAMGTGFNPAVVCDGQTHTVGVTVSGGLFDPGQAKAVADVTAPSGSAHAARSITIFVH